MQNGKEIITVLRHYYCQKNDVAFVLLFGSYAKGTNGFGSDADIAISFISEPSLLELGTMVSELEGLLQMETDLVNLKDISLRQPLLAYNILQNHQVVCMNDSDSYNRFKEEALHHYLDFKPVIDDSNRAFFERTLHGNPGKAKTA